MWYKNDIFFWIFCKKKVKKVVWQCEEKKLIDVIRILNKNPLMWYKGKINFKFFCEKKVKKVI